MTDATLTSKQEVDRWDVFSDGMRKGYGEHWIQATDYDAALAEIERLTAALAEWKSGVTLDRILAERDRLRTSLRSMIEWVKSALRCEQWRWDADQRDAAEADLREAKLALWAGLPFAEAAAGRAADTSGESHD